MSSEREDFMLGCKKEEEKADDIERNKQEI